MKRPTSIPTMSQEKACLYEWMVAMFSTEIDGRMLTKEDRDTLIKL